MQVSAQWQDSVISKELYSLSRYILQSANACTCFALSQMVPSLTVSEQLFTNYRGSASRHVQCMESPAERQWRLGRLYVHSNTEAVVVRRGRESWREFHRQCVRLIWQQESDGPRAWTTMYAHIYSVKSSINELIYNTWI